MSDFLLFERDGPVVTLTMNAPERRNALSIEGETNEAFTEACRRIAAEVDVRAVILTGAGTAFSAGGDLKAMRERFGMKPADIRESYRRGIQRIPLALYDLDVPTIAAVNGPAIGAGLDLACMCDIRIGAESSSYAESFVSVGIVPGDGGAWLLPRAVGQSKAAEMAFTGDRLDARAALECGLISQVVPDAALMDAARALAGRIARNPPQVLRMTKRLLREGQHMRLSSLLEMSAAFQALAHTTRDHEEAVNAWFDKRKPVFEGR
ncbi:enoyl-CoA hydratase [Pseudoroseomonas wenyumeiae]|uniref:Enoyl-CoA hydratase n=1 Tax=Teichococcus wenyumeiae TaxID=2478470 RepID=A0A3A9JZ88_9PROT|nr:crotonase/enoyl-CoA hydratase family protein [Pseudoroseomonas wenyumeiae]RKK04409.1 enoyl-CoA hydratase [Pseudoroseomonas wenyumeiae]RMI19329.1 enoyl-CoA hydratase [Pseudoroseomonas wenyumeiae]